MSINRAKYNNNNNRIDDRSRVGLLSHEEDESKDTRLTWSTFRPLHQHTGCLDELVRDQSNSPESWSIRDSARPTQPPIGRKSALSHLDNSAYMTSQSHVQTLPVNRGQLPKVPRYNVPSLECQKFHEGPTVKRGGSNASLSASDMVVAGDYPVKSTLSHSTVKATPDDADNLQMLRALEAEISTLKNSLQSYDSWPVRPHYDTTQVYESLPSTKSTEKARRQTSLLCKLSQEHGLYRFGHLLDPNISIGTRFVWLIVILACGSLFAYHAVDRVQHFKRSTTRTTVQTKLQKSLAFPTVTICNLNRFRLTKMDAMGLSAKPGSRELLCRDNDDVCKRYTRNLSHEKGVMIAGCRWNGAPCFSSNFTEIFVGDRWCFAIHPEDALISSSGTVSGLTLLLNVEQYEYTPDVRTAVGVRVYIHSPSVKLSGEPINVGVGSHASLAINSVCEQGAIARNPDEQSPKVEAEAIKDEACNRDEMPNSCSFMNGIFSKCDNSGYLSKYRTTLSYSAMSAYAAESQVRSFKKVSDVKRRFLKAMDTYHRTDKTVLQYDLTSLKNISNHFNLDANASGELLRNAQIYRKQANRSLDEVVQSFKKLNDTIWTYLPLFKISSHLTFTNFFKRIHRDVGDIEALVERPNAADVVDSILEKMKPLLDPNENPVIESAIEGVRSFIKDIVKGYGQKYDEFKKEQAAYKSATNLLLNITIRLNAVLKPHYDILSDLFKNHWDSKRQIKIEAEVRRLYRSVKQQTPAVEKIMDLVTTIQTLYTKHRDEIIKFAGTLKDAELKLFAARTALLKRVAYLWDSLPDMQHATNRLSKIFGDVSKEYADGQHNKSTMEDYLSSLGVFQIAEDMQANIEKLREGNTKMAYALASLDESIRVIAKRLAAVPSYPGNPSVLLKKLQYVTSMNKFIDDVTMHTAAVATLRAELTDYKNSLRIDYKFYMNNFLRCDVFFRDFSQTVVSKRIVYGLIDFACDIGGCVALYLGISIITVLQFCDVIARSALATGSDNRQ